MPRALARAINLEGLAARSLCAAEALDDCDSTPTEMNARSGFFETVASPLLITPSSAPELATGVTDAVLTTTPCHAGRDHDQGTHHRARNCQTDRGENLHATPTPRVAAG